MVRRRLPEIVIEVPTGFTPPAKQNLQVSAWPCWPIYRLGTKETLTVLCLCNEPCIMSVHWDATEKRTVPCTQLWLGECHRCVKARPPEQVGYFATWHPTQERIHLLHIPRLALLDSLQLTTEPLWGKQIKARRLGFSSRGQVKAELLPGRREESRMPIQKPITAEQIRDVLFHIWRVQFVPTCN